MQTKVVMYNNTTSTKIMLSNIVNKIIQDLDKYHARLLERSRKILSVKSGMLLALIFCQDLDNKSRQNHDTNFC